MYDSFNLYYRNGQVVLRYGDTEQEYGDLMDTGDEIIENIDLNAGGEIGLISRPGDGEDCVDSDDLEELAMFLNAETGLEFIVEK